MNRPTNRIRDLRPSGLHGNGCIDDFVLGREPYRVILNCQRPLAGTNTNSINSPIERANPSTVNPLEEVTP